MDIQNLNNPEQGGSELNITSTKFEKLSLIILLITIILSAIAFSTTSQSPLDGIKATIISIGVLLSGIFYTLALFNKKTIYLPNHPILYGASLVVISTIVSTFFSSNFSKSLFGQGFELTTTSFTLLMFLASFLVIQLVYKNKERLYYLYSSILVTFVLLMIFHIVRLFDSTLLSFGIFASPASSLIGKWSDLGVFFVLVLLIIFFIFNLIDLKATSIMV
jgi:hypothetical protein